MFSQTITPTQSTLVVEIPGEYVNRPVHLMVIPVPVDSQVQSKKEIETFFAQFSPVQTDWKFNRDELYDR